MNKGTLSGITIILAGISWVSLGWWNENREETEAPAPPTISGQNDLPHNYDRAIRGKKV